MSIVFIKTLSKYPSIENTQIEIQDDSASLVVEDCIVKTSANFNVIFFLSINSVIFYEYLCLM